MTTVSVAASLQVAVTPSHVQSRGSSQNPLSHVKTTISTENNRQFLASRVLTAGEKQGKTRVRKLVAGIHTNSLLILEEGSREGERRSPKKLEFDNLRLGVHGNLTNDKLLLKDRLYFDDQIQKKSAESSKKSTEPEKDLERDDLDENLSEKCSTSYDNVEVDDLWIKIRVEARKDAEEEPALASYIYSTILSHRSLERALAFHLANKLSSGTLLSSQLYTLISDTFMGDKSVRDAIRADLHAVKKRDPACEKYSECFLNYKGFLACQTHRVSHRLWNQNRCSLALALQSRCSEVFHVDIHPGAKLGSGVMLDHATGLVIGETSEIGNNVSILHHVTLGGTGMYGGDRHPKVGDGVLIGAGAILLGNIKIGEGAKIGAKSVVLTDVPPKATAVGNPARIMESKANPNPKSLTESPSLSMDHASFIQWWSDYVI